MEAKDNRGGPTFPPTPSELEYLSSVLEPRCAIIADASTGRVRIARFADDETLGFDWLEEN